MLSSSREYAMPAVALMGTRVTPPPLLGQRGVLLVEYRRRPGVARLDHDAVPLGERVGDRILEVVREEVAETIGPLARKLVAAEVVRGRATRKEAEPVGANTQSAPPLGHRVITERPRRI